jgi:hypothetical protein
VLANSHPGTEIHLTPQDEGSVVDQEAIKNAEAKIADVQSALDDAQRVLKAAEPAQETVAISEDLYTWAGVKRGAKVGSDLGVAMFLTATKSSESTVFNVQTNLSGGTILVSGVARLTNGPSKFTLAVTGGTGKYANARGYVNVRGMSGNKTNLDFHLLP